MKIKVIVDNKPSGWVFFVMLITLLWPLFGSITGWVIVDYVEAVIALGISMGVSLIVFLLLMFITTAPSIEEAEIEGIIIIPPGSKIVTKQGKFRIARTISFDAKTVVEFPHPRAKPKPKPLKHNADDEADAVIEEISELLDDPVSYGDQ